MSKYDRMNPMEQEMNNLFSEFMNQDRSSKANDIYFNGGVLDDHDFNGYTIFHNPTYTAAKALLEKNFPLDDLRFISAFRVMSSNVQDIDRFIEFLNKWKDLIINNPYRNNGPFLSPNPNPWSDPCTPYYYNGVQPLYGCPTPMEIPKEWMGETPSDISRREMSPKKWDDYFASLSNDDVQKEPNETEDETEKKQKEFTEMLYGSTSGVPGPVEPGGLKDRVSLKAILDYPSTGVEINENPVPLTTDEKDSVDKDNEED